MSSSTHGEASSLTRVHSAVSPRSISLPTLISPARAASLRSTGTASSRLPSRMSTVGAMSGTFATIFSLEKSRKWIIRDGLKGISRDRLGGVDGERLEEVAGVAQVGLLGRQRRAGPYRLGRVRAVVRLMRHCAVRDCAGAAMQRASRPRSDRLPRWLGRGARHAARGRRRPSATAARHAPGRERLAPAQCDLSLAELRFGPRAAAGATASRAPLRSSVGAAVRTDTWSPPSRARAYRERPRALVLVVNRRPRGSLAPPRVSA